MPNYNSVTIIGHLVRAPELKSSAGGSSYCHGGVAYNDRKKKVHFFDFTAFGKTAELLASTFEKGEAVGLVGEVHIDSWEKDGVKRSKPVIIVNSLIFIGSGKATENAKPQPRPIPASDYATSLPDDEPAF